MKYKTYGFKIGERIINIKSNTYADDTKRLMLAELQILKVVLQEDNQ